MSSALTDWHHCDDDEKIRLCTFGTGAVFESWEELCGHLRCGVDLTPFCWWCPWLLYQVAWQQAITDPPYKEKQSRVEQRLRGIRAVTASLDYQDLLVECGFGRISEEDWPVSPDPDDDRQSKRMWEAALKQWRLEIRTLRDKHWPHASIVVAFRNLGIPIRMTDLQSPGPYTVGDGNSMIRAFGQSLRLWSDTGFAHGNYLVCHSSSVRLQRFTALQVGRSIVHIDGMPLLNAWDIQDGIMSMAFFAAYV